MSLIGTYEAGRLSGPPSASTHVKKNPAPAENRLMTCDLCGKHRPCQRSEYLTGRNSRSIWTCARCEHRAAADKGQHTHRGSRSRRPHLEPTRASDIRLVRWFGFAAVLAAPIAPRLTPDEREALAVAGCLLLSSIWIKVVLRA